MTKKIQLTMTTTWEYEPIAEDYEKGITIEQMAKFDATHPDIKPIIREEGKESKVSWKIVEQE